MRQNTLFFCDVYGRYVAFYVSFYSGCIFETTERKEIERNGKTSSVKVKLRDGFHAKSNYFTFTLSWPQCCNVVVKRYVVKYM